MAIRKRKYMDHHVDTYQEFICDYLSDIADLPTNCAAGSAAYVLEDWSIWVIDSQGVWHNSDDEAEGE